MVRSGYCPNGTRQKCRSKWNCWILLCRLSSVTDPVRKTISYSLISTTGLSANLWKRGWKSADNKGYFISVLKLLNGRNFIRQKIRLLTAIFSLHSESLQFDCHKQPRVAIFQHGDIVCGYYPHFVLFRFLHVYRMGVSFSRTNHNRTGDRKSVV